MAWQRTATSHCLNQGWSTSLTHICGSRGIWVKWTSTLWLRNQEKTIYISMSHFCLLHINGFPPNAPWRKWNGITVLRNVAINTIQVPVSHLTASLCILPDNLLFWQTVSFPSSRLSHWGRDKMAVIFQTTFLNTFSWVKMYEFRSRFHLSLFLSFELRVSQHLVQIMAWRRPGDKPLSEPMMVILSTHICVTRASLSYTRQRHSYQNAKMPACFNWHICSYYEMKTTECTLLLLLDDIIVLLEA